MTRRETALETFQSALGRGELLYQECTSCRRPQFYPRSVCRHCHGSDLEWRRATGRGTIFSFTVVHRGPRRDVPVPYTLALIDLEEGVRLLARVEGDGTVELGKQVRIRIVEGRGGTWQPLAEIV